MTVQITLRLPEELVAEMDDLISSGRFDNRTTAVRQAVTDLLDAHRRRQIDDAIVTAYTSAPADLPDDWGPLPDPAREALDPAEPW